MGGVGRAARGRLGLAGLLLAMAACASPPGRATVHVVRPGETIYRISRYYGVSVREVVRANRIHDVTAVAIGTRLVVPGARRRQPTRPLSLMHRTPPPLQGDFRALARREGGLEFMWPLKGRVSSRYGWRNGRRHEGIDIPSPRGTPIRAAEAGKVIHSGTLGDYGRVIILKHAGSYKTVYAHNHKNGVRRGQFVERGDVIGEVGKTGNASGSHLHFEVRLRQRPQDPLVYLP